MGIIMLSLDKIIELVSHSYNQRDFLPVCRLWLGEDWYKGFTNSRTTCDLLTYLKAYKCQIDELQNPQYGQ